jgi:hypothetical protein
LVRVVRCQLAYLFNDAVSTTRGIWC